MKKNKLRKPFAAAIALLLAAACLAGCTMPWQKPEPEEPVDPALPLYRIWTAEYSITDYAAAAAEEWLGHEISMADYMPELSVEVTLTFAADGNWRQRAAADGLAAAQQQAEAALAAALANLTQQRLTAACCGVPRAEEGSADVTIEADAGDTAPTAVPGDAPEADADYTAAQIMNTFGMSAEEYIAQLGLKLVPTAEELQARFDRGGCFAADGSTLYLSFSNEAADENSPDLSYLTGGGKLVFTGGSAELGWPEMPLMFTTDGGDVQ